MEPCSAERCCGCPSSARSRAISPAPSARCRWCAAPRSMPWRGACCCHPRTRRPSSATAAAGRISTARVRSFITARVADTICAPTAPLRASRVAVWRQRGQRLRCPTSTSSTAHPTRRRGPSKAIRPLRPRSVQWTVPTSSPQNSPTRHTRGSHSAPLTVCTTSRRPASTSALSPTWSSSAGTRSSTLGAAAATSPPWSLISSGPRLIMSGSRSTTAPSRAQGPNARPSA